MTHQSSGNLQESAQSLAKENPFTAHRATLTTTATSCRDIESMVLGNQPLGQFVGNDSIQQVELVDPIERFTDRDRVEQVS